MALDFQKKRRVKRFLYSRVTLIVLLLLVMLIGKAAWNAYQVERQTAATLEQMRREHTELAEREAFLEHELDRLATEAGVVEEIRTRYGFARPDEGVVFIVEEEEQAEEKAPETIWERFKAWFSSDEEE